MYSAFALWYFRRLLKDDMGFKFPNWGSIESIRSHTHSMYASPVVMCRRLLALGSPIELDERFEDYKIVRHYRNPLKITNPSGNFLSRFKIKGPLGKRVVHLKRKGNGDTSLKVEVVEGGKPRTIQVPISEDDMEIFDMIMMD